MAHFAQLDANGIVQQVVVVSNADAPTEEAGITFLRGLLGHPHWAQCSYNGNMRKQFPGVGFSYDAVNDVFVAPRPFASWLLDQNHDWQPPTPRPSEGRWYWDEATTSWVEA